MRLLWLAEDCRRAGLKVVELPDWERRGVEFAAFPDTLIVHHTATPAKARGDLPTKKILIEGRSDLPGPLCQVGLGRNGTVYVVASGKANHAGKGTWLGMSSSAKTIGIEAEHDGVSAWSLIQYEAYVKLCAVLLRGIGQSAERLAGHKEWALPAGRKSDPNFDMPAFRALVRKELGALIEPVPAPTGGDDDVTPEDIEKIAQRVKQLVAQDLAVLLHGTKDGSHPANLDNIWKAVQK